MSETAVVVGTFLVCYGSILGYVLYLHMRRRKAGN